MAGRFPFELLDDPAELSSYQGWSEQVYHDLLALKRGELSSDEFDAKYLRRRAILVLDLTGFTESTMRGGALVSFLRILDAQTVCLPVLRERGAELIRTFADDIVALFPDANAALDAALDMHERTDHFIRGSREAAECCVGLGYGDVYSIGPNLAMGDEMNRASKLGEDTARGGETLLTEGAYQALRVREGLVVEPQTSDDLIFPYFRLERGR
jgi:class 3 adenylate cyclase